MRISDEERCETIENLRRLSYMNRVRYKEEFYELLDETVMEPDIGYHEMNEVFERIADLIDRPTCAIVESYMGDNLESVEETPHHVLSCGHIAYGEDDPMFCPVCGAAVTDDYR